MCTDMISTFYSLLSYNIKVSIAINKCLLKIKVYVIQQSNATACNLNVQYAINHSASKVFLFILL